MIITTLYSTIAPIDNYRCGQACTVSAPIGDRRPLIWQMGDSYKVGISAQQASYNDFRVMCALPGTDGISGNGWTIDTGWPHSGLVCRESAGVITRTPDYIFFSLGYNDYAPLALTTSPARLFTLWPPYAASVHWQESSSLALIGPATPARHNTKLDAVCDVLIERCNALGLPFVDVRDIVNSSNASLYTGTDAVYPSTAGHVYRGTQIALRVA